MNDMAMNVGQPILATLVTKRQSRVVDATQVHDRGLHVVNVNRILLDVPGKFVSGSVDGPR